MIKTCIFDFDGTLVDSMPTFVASVTDILDRLDIRYEKEQLVCDITPLGADGTAQYLIDMGIDMTKEELLSVMRSYSMGAYVNSIPEKEGAASLLASLAERGIKIYMLTANSHIQIDPCLKRLSLYDHFEKIWSCDDLDLKKTDTKIYDAVCEMIGAKKDEVLFFDDNPDAIKTAKAAGLSTCAVYDSSSDDYIDVLKESADIYLDKLSDFSMEVLL